MSLEVITTARLLARLPREADRDRFVQLFRDEDFMVFYPDVLTEEQAEDRFDQMVAVCQTIPFGKQPVVELSSGLVVGYAGVDCIDFEGRTWLEWGYRLVPECRGPGYATEASQALLAKAHQTYAGRGRHPGPLHPGHRQDFGHGTKAPPAEASGSDGNKQIPQAERGAVFHGNEIVCRKSRA